MNYSNMGERAKGAKDRVEADRAPLEEGTFKCILRGGEFGKSRSNNDMFTLKMKVTDNSASERMQGETLKIRFVITPNTEHQLDQLLAVLNDWGADLSKVKKDDDWEDVFIDLTAARAKAVIEVVRDTKNEKYCNFNWMEVIRCLNLDEAEEVEAPAKPKAKPKAKKKPEPPPVEDTDDDEDEPDTASEDTEDVDW